MSLFLKLFQRITLLYILTLFVVMNSQIDIEKENLNLENSMNNYFNMHFSSDISKEDSSRALNELFQLYCKLFKKKYCNLDDNSLLEVLINRNTKENYDYSMNYFFRKSVFTNTLDLIYQHNIKSKSSFKIGLTKFSDMTKAELKQKYLNEPIKLRDVNFEFLRKINALKEEQTNGEVNNEKTHFINEFLQPIDWRDSGIFLPVRDQENCGACWAFASVGVIESLRALKSGTKKYLSPQQLVDCDDKEKGCKGGWPSIAYSYVSRAGGVVSDETYPYIGNDESCKSSLITESNIEVQIEDSILRCDEDECHNNDTQYKFLLKGPVAVTIDAYNTLFFNYKSGYYDESCSEPNHAIMLVGYGVDKTKNISYWIIRNSWGENWGMEGFGYIKNNPTNNYSCNVNRYGYQPIIKTR